MRAPYLLNGVSRRKQTGAAWCAREKPRTPGSAGVGGKWRMGGAMAGLCQVLSEPPIGGKRNTAAHMDLLEPQCPGMCILNTAVCTANGLPPLNVRCGDSWVTMWWALFCWRNGVAFDTASPSVTFGVADLFL
ncbi:hypothetical protein NDU88_006550 [Pleurodeles waltl]|uniref:Uncharacterized protein n=1 Tax=Pleurodeles waltl TaxID=8319 RepID=A0AAV7ULT6_PLEWA|nr:hypothetical protein NDU88_006550 [Pleurodeles waltl]